MPEQTTLGAQRPGTLHAAEQAVAEAQRQYQTKQAEVSKLARDLAALDQEPDLWTAELVSTREANRRNWTKARAQAQQALLMSQRDVETATVLLTRVQARVRELPGLIDRLRVALTPQGDYGQTLAKAAHTLKIVQDEHRQHTQELAALEAELQTLGGS